MKKTWIYIACMAFVASTMFTSCDISSSRNYLGTMAGAEIGGVVGEALGWMSTSRHDGPGKAMLGSVIGTVAGAAIGNSLTKDRPEQTEVRVGRGSKRSRSREQQYGGVDYQTGGGYSDYDNRSNYDSHSNYGGQSYYGGQSFDRNNAYSPLLISNLTYQDEDGDGRFSRNETVNIIYEVTNTSAYRCDNVKLKVETVESERSFALSPANTVSIAPHETIRYKAKAFCKSRPSKNVARFTVSAGNDMIGFSTSQLQIKMWK